jgi:hypothetical protein
MSKWVTYRGLSIEVHPVDGFTVWDDRLAPLGRRRFIDYSFREVWDLIERGEA